MAYPEADSPATPQIPRRFAARHWRRRPRRRPSAGPCTASVAGRDGTASGGLGGPGEFQMGWLMFKQQEWLIHVVNILNYDG
jgi:hypothetical protein